MTNPGDSQPQLPETTFARLRRRIVGGERDVHDPSLRHKMSLMALLAWVGLGADGLSSSAYGPEEAFRTLGEHRYLALALAGATAATVFIISFAYSRIIEKFPHGGGGYLVATHLLGDSAGVVSGCALLVDYILTITVSIAGGGDAIFSLLPIAWQPYKLPVEYGAVIILMVLNLRGVKESVTVLIPIFLTFVLTHAMLIGGGLIYHLWDLPAVATDVRDGFRGGVAQLGIWGMVLLFLRAYSLGGGTYTGIEAVSNGLAILREPKVETGKRTMFYMATSLAATAGGLLLCYMLAGVRPKEGQTLNTVLANGLAGGIHLGGVPVGTAFVFVAIFSEAVLLLVAAQTGFLDGPRVMANMAIDSWLPRRFAGVSDRLTMQNGILLMGLSAIATLTYTRGHIGILVVMYSINVFLTFSLTELGMVRSWWQRWRATHRLHRDMAIHGIGLVLCVSILCVMLFEKLGEGGWITLSVTLALVVLCFGIRRHYRLLVRRLHDVDRTFVNLPALLKASPTTAEFDPEKPTAVVLVGRYGGLGLHILMTVIRLFRETFHNVVFITVGVVDSAFFREGQHVERLEAQTREMLDRYVEIAQRMGKPARREFRIGTDVVEEASELCAELSRQYSRTVFFAGTLAFDKPRWYDRILHNETAYAIQRRIKFAGLPMVILPMMVSLGPPKKPA